MSEISLTIVENDVDFEVVAQNYGNNDTNTALVLKIVGQADIPACK